MGNGFHECWNSLPDSLLLQIFEWLQAKDVLIAATVIFFWTQASNRIRVAKENEKPIGKQWHRVAGDELLWRQFLLCDYKLAAHRPTILSPFCNDSWRLEYKRLAALSPIRLSQTLHTHKDEVLHVAFSPDGTMFATTSKDCTLQIWSTRHPCQQIGVQDLHKQFHWHYTQLAAFNRTSELVLVSGVHFGSFQNMNSDSGEIAVYEIDCDTSEDSTPGQLQLLFRCRVVNRPYDLFGTWYDTQHVLNGEYHQFTNLYSCSALWLCKASQDTHTERTAVLAPLYRFLNSNGSTLRMLLVSEHVTDGIKFAIQYQREVDVKGAEAEIDIDAIVNAIQPSDSASSVASKCDNCERKHAETETDDACTCICHGDVADRMLIYSFGRDTYVPHCVGFKWIQGKEVLSKLNAEVMTDERIQQVKDRMRQKREAEEWREAHMNEEVSVEEMIEEGVGLDLLIEGEEPADPPEEESWEDFRRNFTQPDHVVDFHGHIIGLALSHDERYVFVNVRPWPDDAIISDPREPPPIAQQIEVHVIDLETLSRNEEVYRGHRGFTANDQCFFMFMDAGARFVGSGSEDSCGYVWDRHHRCLIGKLEHSSVVSAVAFNPLDSEMAVSVSDDNTVKVWRSKRVLLEAVESKMI